MSETNDLVTVVPEKLQQHANFLGEPLLSYILNLPEQEIKALIKEGGEVDAKRLVYIDQLDQVMDQVKKNRINDQAIHFADYAYLSNLQLANESYLFNAIRNDLYDSPAPQQFDDPVLECFAELGAESYPYFLLPKDNRFSELDLCIPYFIGTKILSRTEDAILLDPDLSNIFPTVGSNGMETVSRYHSSTGHGGSLQLCTFPSMLLKNAYGWMRSQNLNNLDAYISAISDVLDMLRQAARGEAVKIPIIYCFEGIRLPEGTKINAFNGIISNLSNGILDILPQHGHPTSHNSDGVMGFVFVSEIEFRLHITQPGDSAHDLGDLWPIKMIDLNALHQITEKISLSIALAIGPDAPAAASVISTYISDPLNGGHSSSCIRMMQTATNPITATVDDCQRIQEWCKFVENADDQKIDMANRRFLSAVTKRDDPIDGFVDSIIAMENLFGERTAIALSVAASVSKLVETDAERRKEVFEEVKKLYSRRSDIIHGKKQAPSHEDAVIFRDKSLGFVAECLRRLYRDDVELLQLSANDRA